MGNLADLGLADIFQIVSLSRRSGTLQLSTQLETGEIIFLDGRVVAAFRSGADWSVGDVLLEAGVITPTTFQDMLAAQARGVNGTLLAKQFALDADGWESAVKTMMSDIVYAMFEWDDGTFSFVLEQGIDPWRGFALGASRAVVSQGVNPQYLAMEGARRRDERQQSDSLSQFLSRDASEEPANSTSSAAAAEPEPEPELELAIESEDTPAVPAPPAPVSAPSAAEGPPTPVATEGLETAPELPVPAPEPPPSVEPSRSKVIPFPRRTEEAPAAAEPPAGPLGNAVPAMAEEDTRWTLVALDDDENVLATLKDRFANRFREVRCVERVPEALLQIESAHTPVVVVADVLLPRSDGRGILGGIELAERLRTHGPAPQPLDCGSR
ncbi:MAG: response regulator [Myxococcota bacterium]